MTWSFILLGVVLLLVGGYQLLPLSRKRFLKNLASQLRYLLPRYFV